MRKVYIIDDEKLIREGLTHYINWDKLGMEIVGSAGDGMTALEEIKLEDAAEMINMSASHFGRLFKEITGENFSRYVYRIRMEKSKELICNSTYKIYEIAEMVGYTDISHFSKKFKEYFGYSPVQLR